MGEKRLRIAALSVTPTVVWDDGENLEPGPSLSTLIISVLDIPTLRERLEAELPRLEAQGFIGVPTTAKEIDPTKPEDNA